MNKQAFFMGYLKAAAADPRYSERQVRNTVNREINRNRDKNRSVALPMLGGAALLGGGAGMYGAGKLMQASGDISFNQLQRGLNSIPTPAMSYDPIKPPEGPIERLKQLLSQWSSGSDTTVLPKDLDEGVRKGIITEPTKWQDFTPSVKLKDFNPTVDPKINSAIGSTFDAPDSLRGLLAYNDAGHRLLSEQSYKGVSNYDLIKWFRSPANTWWRKFVPGQEWPFEKFPTEDTFMPAWGNYGPINMHYKSFSHSVPRALRQFTFENSGNLDNIINNLAKARKDTVLALMGQKGLTPEQIAQSYKDTSANVLGEYTAPLTSPAVGIKDVNSIKSLGGALKNIFSPLAASPLVRNKHEASARQIASAIENTLANSDASIASVLQSTTPDAIANRDYRADILRALKAEGPDGIKTRVEGLLNQADQAAGKAGVDPTQQAEAIYGALKNDPMAHVMGMSPHRGVPYPLATVMYSALRKAGRLPGELAHSFTQASPLVKGTGLGLGAAGLGLGAYGLMNWFKRRQANKKQNLSVPVTV